MAARPRNGPTLVLGVLLALATLLAGCGNSRSAAPAATQPPTASAPAGSAPTGSEPAASAPSSAAVLRWHSCQASFQCATLSVPLDYRHPQGRQISLALIRSVATDPARRLGSLVINPGGPGESTLSEFSFLVGELDPSLRARFDIVGFDPRGVGASTPLQCLSGPALDTYFALDLDPTTAAQRAVLESKSRAFAAGCEQRDGWLLPYLGTATVARDLDRIRAALGDAKLTYLGFSYGTFLGAEYAHEFPTHVRALVLDGALDPTLPALSSLDAQSAGFQGDWRAFRSWCADPNNGCAWQPAGGREADLHALLARLVVRPERVGARALGPGEASYGISVALYSMQSWPDLGTALQAADAGQGADLLQLSDDYTERNTNGSYSNLIEVEDAVDCIDTPWPTNPAAYFQAARASAAIAPDFGPENILSSLVCAYWPVRSPGPVAPPSALGAPPVLVVASTGDPATPYAEGVALSRELGVGRLLTRVGEGHTGYDASSCVRGYADSYLLSGAVSLPPLGERCPSG